MPGDDSLRGHLPKVHSKVKQLLEKAKAVLSRLSPDINSFPSPFPEPVTPLDDRIDEEKAHPDTQDRFVYKPKSFFERLAVSARVKNRLSQSRCVKIPYRLWCKYLLILLLLLVGAFFTPQLVPNWLGFEWASPKDLCLNREHKLSKLHYRIENLTKLPELRLYVDKQRFDMVCMDTAAANFYQSPRRFQWPSECSREMASSSLEEEVCVGPTEKNVCEDIGPVQKLFANIAQTCKTVQIPKKCETVVDSDRTQALLELEREEAAQSLNATVTETQPILETANEKATEIVNRLLLQVDIASDIFIVYSIISIVIGMPLVIYKREKGSQILGATFGLQKMHFVLLVVVALTFYDSFMVVMKETDFSRMFKNFRNDPCYVDVGFSRRRVTMIVHACNNVTELNMNSSITLQEMDGVYFTTRRFGICADTTRPAEPHPRSGDMDLLRKRYRDGDLRFPGVCNATLLDEATSTAPNDPEFSKFRALLGSGVLAQLLLKFVLTSWLIHLISFQEPMVPHNGKVEVWDAKKEEEEGGSCLNERERQSAIRFARDKHLLPLIIMSLLMVVEVFLIVYSLVATKTGRQDLGGSPVEELSREFRCPFDLQVE